MASPRTARALLAAILMLVVLGLGSAERSSASAGQAPPVAVDVLNQTFPWGYVAGDRSLLPASHDDVGGVAGANTASLLIPGGLALRSGFKALAGTGARRAIATSLPQFGTRVRTVTNRLIRDERGSVELGAFFKRPRTAAKELPDAAIIVRGGESDVPGAGKVFSGAHGQTLDEAAAGVPHGQIRSTTAGKIRAGGGTVERVPEYNPRVGRTNYQHVNVCLGKGSCPFSDLFPNPVPKAGRFGGPDYPYDKWSP